MITKPRIRRNPEEARALILAAAGKRLEEHGLRGLNIKDVADDSGIKHGTLLHHFGSAEGMRRFRETVTETAGFYNTVGFNDDTRAFCSIPARHDVARRVDCAYLATLVATGRLAEDEAAQVAYDLTYRLAKQAYRL